MKKSLIIPIFGLFILGVSTFFFFDKKEERENKNVALPSSLFDTADFYDMKALNQKELDDVEKNKSAADMGTRAKGLKSMMRTLTFKAAEANTTILFSNHTYDDPAALYPSLVKNQSGGKGPVYLASVLVQLAKRDEKHDKTNEDDQVIAAANKYSGCTLRALTVKNRFVPPFLECEMYLNFKTGLDKYSGLREIAIDQGVVIQTGSTYQLPDGTKLGYYKNWKDDKDLWTKTILPGIEKKLEEVYKYS